MVRGLLAVWETGVRLPVFQGTVDVGVRMPMSKELVGARPLCASTAPAGPAPSIGHLEAGPVHCRHQLLFSTVLLGFCRRL